MGEERGVFLWEGGAHNVASSQEGCSRSQQTPPEVYKSAHSQITLSLPAPRPYQPTSFMPRPSLLTEGCVRLGDWGRWEHILESTLMTKESRTWHGRVVSLDPCAGSTRDTGLKSSKAGGPWGNKGQTRLSQGRDTSSGRKEVSTAQ